MPGDDRGDRVDALVARRGDELDPARVGDAGHADAAGRPAVELRLGLLGEPVEQRADVAALGVGRVDRDRPAGVAEPAESQVRTLKPALRSAPTPTLPVASSLAAFGLVSREPPQPWPSRIVGAFPPCGAGWKERTIWVPSNDVMVASRAWAAGAARTSSGRREEGAHGSRASFRPR